MKRGKCVCVRAFSGEVEGAAKEIKEKRWKVDRRRF